VRRECERRDEKRRGEERRGEERRGEERREERRRYYRTRELMHTPLYGLTSNDDVGVLVFFEEVKQSLAVHAFRELAR